MIPHVDCEPEGVSASRLYSAPHSIATSSSCGPPRMQCASLAIYYLLFLSCCSDSTYVLCTFRWPLSRPYNALAASSFSYYSVDQGFVSNVDYFAYGIRVRCLRYYHLTSYCCYRPPPVRPRYYYYLYLLEKH